MWTSMDSVARSEPIVTPIYMLIEHFSTFSIRSRGAWTVCNWIMSTFFTVMSSTPRPRSTRRWGNFAFYHSHRLNSNCVDASSSWCSNSWLCSIYRNVDLSRLAVYINSPSHGCYYVLTSSLRTHSPYHAKYSLRRTYFKITNNLHLEITRSTITWLHSSRCKMTTIFSIARTNMSCSLPWRFV